MMNFIMLKVIMLSVIMLNVIMLNVIMLSVIMLNFIILSVVAPILLPEGEKNETKDLESGKRRFLFKIEENVFPLKNQNQSDHGFLLSAKGQTQ